MNNAFTNYTFKNGMSIKNKLVLAPMTTYSSNDDLTLSDEEEIYYNARAKQFGIVITAATAVSKNAQAFPNQISVRDERYLGSMKRLVYAIKKEGSRAILQIHHGGRMNVPGLYPNQEIVAPSAIKANRDYAVEPRELKTSEVYDIIDSFCNATKLAIKAGFDGVELHGANTYLIQQFFSPNSNTRDDEFGSTLDKRLTFPLLLVDRIKRVRKLYTKKPFIVGYRFSPEELENPGITLDDTLRLIDELAKKDIDYLHVSLGKYNQTSLRDKRDLEPVITKFVKVVNNRVPIIGVGQIESNQDIEKAFDLGYDLLALGLISLSDDKIVEHLQNGDVPNKVISKESLLPKNLYNRLSSWMKDGSRGYSIKEES